MRGFSDAALDSPTSGAFSGVTLLSGVAFESLGGICDVIMFGKDHEDEFGTEGGVMFCLLKDFSETLEGNLLMFDVGGPGNPGIIESPGRRGRPGNGGLGSNFW